MTLSVEELSKLAQLASQLDPVLTIVSILGSVATLWAAAPKIRRRFVYRHVRRILGIKDGDKVLVVCSELDDPLTRQMVEPREFIYLMKYGDLDAWVELIFSLLRIYPNIDLHVMSSGEALSSKVDLEHQIICIGGPDYNLLVRRIMDKDATRIRYGSQQGASGDEITVVDSATGSEYYFEELDRDYGYIERIVNPFDSDHQILLFGGCHTVGVTAATKFISAFGEGRGKVSKKTLTNARALSKELGRARKKTAREFSLLIEASKVGSSIMAPVRSEAELFVAMRPNSKRLGS
ncbi:MAG: hypothetical protein ACRCYU_16165 [Nocardioides sp.]